MWGATTFPPLVEPRGHRGEVLAVSVSPDAERMISRGNGVVDNSASTVVGADGTLHWTIDYARDGVFAIAVTDPNVPEDAEFVVGVRQATRDLEDNLDNGRDLATRLRNGIRTRYGLKAEKLADFNLRPRRPGQKANSNKKKVPEPVPAPPAAK